MKEHISIITYLVLFVSLIEVQNIIMGAMFAQFIYSSMAYNLSWVVSGMLFLWAFCRIWEASIELFGNN